jgi:hypothetical protein
LHTSHSVKDLGLLERSRAVAGKAILRKNIITTAPHFALIHFGFVLAAPETGECWPRGSPGALAVGCGVRALQDASMLFPEWH